MPSFRCSLCALDWPADDKYADCPQCDEPTTPFSNVKAMPRKEAKSLRTHIDFEKFYEEWDATQPPERLAPTASDPVC